MAFGIRPPPMAEWIVNLGEAAEYMFDHNIFQDNLVGVDFCETDGPGDQPRRPGAGRATAAPHAERITASAPIADIMRPLNPFTGAFYREALQMSRTTREMFCLMEGGTSTPRPSTPAASAPSPRVQLFTDYLVAADEVRRVHEEGRPAARRPVRLLLRSAARATKRSAAAGSSLGCWGSFQNPDVCDFTYENMAEWGRAMYVTSGVVVDGELVTTDLVEINLGFRILSGQLVLRRLAGGRDVRQERPPGQPGRPPPPVEPDDAIPEAAEAGLRRNKYTWVMSPRWCDARTGRSLGARHGGGPLARFWATALAGLVDIGYVQADRPERQDLPAQVGRRARSRVRVEDPQVEQRHRARPRSDCFQAYAAAAALYFVEAGARRAPRRPDQDLDRVQGSRTRRSAAASTRPCAWCSRTMS